MSRRIAMVSMHTSPLESPGSADAGGMNVVELNTALALADLGYAVDLITRRSGREQGDEVAIAPGVRLLHLDAGEARTLPKSQIDGYLPQFTQALEELGDYDLYHCQHWMSGMAALDLARRRHVPVVVNFHSVAAPLGCDLDQGEPPESPGRLPGEARLAREADQILTISAAEAHTVLTRCGADPDRVSIIGPGVDLEMFHPQTRLATERATLACAARLQPLKGLDLAIAALGRIEPTLRPRLVIAGAESLDFADYAAQLRAQVETLALEELVSFVGPASREQLAGLFAQAELVLVPSHSETFGLVALEAAAAGTPVLAAASGGLREAVIDGETGRLIESRDPGEWARAITALLGDSGARARMGAVARIHARRFPWTLVARRVADVYERLWRSL